MSLTVFPGKESVTSPQALQRINNYSMLRQPAPALLQHRRKSHIARWIMGKSASFRMHLVLAHVCSGCEVTGCGRRRWRNPAALGNSRKAHRARQAQSRPLPWAAEGGGDL